METTDLADKWYAAEGYPDSIAQTYTWFVTSKDVAWYFTAGKQKTTSVKKWLSIETVIVE